MSYYHWLGFDAELVAAQIAYDTAKQRMLNHFLSQPRITYLENNQD